MKDEEEMTRMLARLRTVDVPDNFEGQVRSRIAERRVERPLARPSLLLVAKFAFPMLLLMAVGGFVMLSNERELSGEMVPPVSIETHDVAVVDDSLTRLPGTSGLSDGNSRIDQGPVNRGRGNLRPGLQGGSEDIGLSPDESTVFPDGVDPRKTNLTTVNPPGGGSISPADVLLMIGITTDCSTTGCFARAVRERSIAAVAGVENGDLISAIDGKAINASTSIAGTFTLSELTIVRSGRTISISIGRR